MTIEIQVQGGKVTISVGGQPAPDEAPGKVTSQGTVENKTASQTAATAVSAARAKPDKGATPAEKPPKGGSGSSDKAAIGGSGPLSGVVVIGPIVIGCGDLGNGSQSKSGGSGSSDKAAIGGSGSSDKAAIGGSGSSDKAAIGGAGPLSGTVVIGPIVVGGGYSGTSTTGDTTTTTSAVFTANPQDEE